VVARNYVFGPNSIQESASTDFNVSLLDDPQSYSALMTPIDPSMLAFLQRQNLDPSILLPLVISEIRVITTKGAVYEFQTDQGDHPKFFSCARRTNGDAWPHCDSHLWGREETDDDPKFSEKKRECRDLQTDCVVPAMLMLAYPKDHGISFQVPVGSAPGAQQTSSPSARICFDPVIQDDQTKNFEGLLKEIFSLHEPPDLTNYSDFSVQTHYKPAPKSSGCDENTIWIKQTNSKGSDLPQESSAGRAVGSASVYSVCRDGACRKQNPERVTQEGRHTKRPHVRVLRR
jgi:hypothetical protein